MALEDILAAIRSETDGEIRQIREACAEEVAAVEAAARDKALEAEQIGARSRDLSADREVARIVNRATLNANQELIHSVELAFQEALDAVRLRLGAVRGTVDYPPAVARLLDEGLDVMPDATAVRVDPLDVGVVEALLVERDRGDLDIEPSLTSTGGVDLITDDGRAVLNTFEARLARADGRLRRLATEHIPDRRLLDSEST